MTENDKVMKDLKAVSISQGPGSYTGLRVGMSTAKGICYGLDIPLIGISTLESLAVEHLHADKYVIPAMDARRNEVYFAIFDSKGNRQTDDQSLVIEKSIYPAEWPSKTEVIICGNGAEKTSLLLEEIASNCVITNCKSANQVDLAWSKFHEKQFLDLFYAVPNYLKPPNITTPRKKVF